MTNHATTTDRNQPDIKVPEHFSTTKPGASKEDKIDSQMEDSFPASDPPSFSGGNHIIGAPTGRESESPKADSPDVMAAEQKVMDGKAVEPKTY